MAFTQSTATMRPGHWAVSVVIVAVLATKVVEIGWGIGSWPVSNVSMFSGWVPPTWRPRRARLIGEFGRTSRVIEAAEVGLDPSTLKSRLLNAPDRRALCETLAGVFRRRHPDRAVDLTAMELRTEFLSRSTAPPDPPEIVICAGGAVR